MTDSISIHALAQLMARKDKAVLLDVRRKHDVEQSPQKIVGAEWYDPEEIETWAATIPQDRDVVVYCVKGGPVSQSVTEKLTARACRAKYLEGGIKAWRENEGMVD